LKGASTCKLEIGGHGVLDKKMKVKFGTKTHRLEGLLNCVPIEVWGPTKTTSLRDYRYFISFIDNLSRRCCVYSM